MEVKLIIFLFIFLIILCICYLIKKILLRLETSFLGMVFKLISTVMKTQNDNYIMYKEEPRSISGLTKLLEPKIKRDFPMFNKELIFSYIEGNLKMIFNSLEKRELRINNNLSLIKTNLEQQIENMIHNNIYVKYNEIVFHKHAIKSYERSNGIATLTLSTSVEYYYYNSLQKEKIYNEIKKQDKYETKFIYIYDYSKLKEDNVIQILRCPNCGAPIIKLNPITCDYCKSGINEIDLRLWKMIHYKKI